MKIAAERWDFHYREDFKRYAVTVDGIVVTGWIFADDADGDASRGVVVFGYRKEDGKLVIQSGRDVRIDRLPEEVPFA
jgi:hypothetical protein